MSKVYDDSSIQQMEGADRVRKRPAALLGSNGLDGAKHTVVEILGNALDEVTSGYGDQLDVTLHEDHSITIRDYGRGVPMGLNQNGKWNWYLIYSELYAGGKYDDSQEVLRGIKDWSTFDPKNHSYLFSIGLNGLGAAASQYTSEFFNVTSYRDGKASTMRFRKGVNVLEELEVVDTDEPNGTKIHWKPDSEVFTDVNIPADWLRERCRIISYISGIEVRFTEDGLTAVYEASSATKLLTEKLKGSSSVLTKKVLHHETDNLGDICVMVGEVAIGDSSEKRNGVFEFYHNQIEIHGGVHESGSFTAISDFLNSKARDAGLRLVGSDVTGVFSVVISGLSNKISPRGQTKDSLEDLYILRAVHKAISTTLEDAYARKEKWVHEAVKRVLEYAEQRLRLEELSKTLKVVEKETKKQKTPDKFVSCISYSEGRAAETELWLVEGDSAGGSLKASRNADTQCFFPLRGKGLNVFKAPVEKILDNAEIKGLINILGCGIELDKHNGIGTFDITKLRCNKIIFASDADVDGWHIRVLLFLIMYRLFPELLYEGYVYVAETPRYMVKHSNGTETFCLDDEELEAEKAKGTVVGFSRFKGLGQVDAEILKRTTVDPETRNLVQIKIDRNDTEVYDVIEVLFGTSTNRRKMKILNSLMGGGVEELYEKLAELQNEISKQDFDTETVVKEVLYTA